MKSSTGQHYPALDHVRALAAFLVFVWHFTHATSGYPVPYQGAPIAPLALFDEGHTGVAVFMTLSGYLFAKLLDGKDINFPAFLWSRFVRLAPLLIFVILLVGIQRAWLGGDMIEYARQIALGPLLWTFPNGGWSITVEAHFYVILPFLLFVARKNPRGLLLLIVAAIAIRLAVWGIGKNIHWYAYATIIGRFDQFALGIIAFLFRGRINGRIALIGAASFIFFYWTFDIAGGRNNASLRLLWVVMPTIEGAAYGLLIGWYDGRGVTMNCAASRAASKIGDLSYSLYLLHFFFVFAMANFVHQYIMDISNFYLALAWAVPAFILMLPICWLSYRFIETPPRRFQGRYTTRSTEEHGRLAARSLGSP